MGTGWMIGISLALACLSILCWFVFVLVVIALVRKYKDAVGGYMKMLGL